MFCYYLNEIFNLQALALLCDSSRVFMDLKRFLDVGEKEEHASYKMNIIVRRWEFLEPKDEFRCFCVDGKITCASQYIDCLFFDYDIEDIRSRLKDFEANVLSKYVKDLPYCFVLDLALCKDGVRVIELNPFYHKTGACLFDWKDDKELLLHGDCTIRVQDKEKGEKEAAKEFDGLEEEMKATKEQLKKQAETTKSEEKKCFVQ